MLFNILLAVMIVIPFISAFLGYMVSPFPVLGVVFGLFTGLMIAIIPCLGVFASWTSHSADIATIESADRLIVVYEKQRESLTKTMGEFTYPKGSVLSADAPIASIVTQLGEVERALTKVRAEEVEAHRSIIATSHGPMSGVIKFVGKYEIGSVRDYK
jgi:hypothetical protein